MFIGHLPLYPPSAIYAAVADYYLFSISNWAFAQLLKSRSPTKTSFNLFFILQFLKSYVFVIKVFMIVFLKGYKFCLTNSWRAFVQSHSNHFCLLTSLFFILTSGNEQIRAGHWLAAADVHGHPNGFFQEKYA